MWAKGRNETKDRANHKDLRFAIKPAIRLCHFLVWKYSLISYIKRTVNNYTPFLKTFQWHLTIPNFPWRSPPEIDYEQRF